MGVGAIAEPLAVITLLFGGAWVNRTRSQEREKRRPYHSGKREDSPGGLESGPNSSKEETDRLLSPRHTVEQDGWRHREISILGFRKQVQTPDTQVFEDRFLSRVLWKFPFLIEAWYWFCIYWVYQLGRAVSAVTLLDGTVDIARRHALQLVHLEQHLHIFIEPQVQRFFMAYPTLMHWINRIYSFIHIPGTILFLVCLYYYTVTSNRIPQYTSRPGSPTRASGTPAGPALYQGRRRTMAMCNLIAFIVFTAWPCMPPRLLSDPSYIGSFSKESQSYGFIDTVHSSTGESSVWTQNKFCNQYAAMPSLHFGYSLLVGITTARIPLASSRTGALLRWRRLLVVLIGVAYPSIILVAIIATANHFVLDAVAGAVICSVAWNANGVLVNFLVLEDWFLWGLRMHKPEVGVAGEYDGFGEKGCVY